MWRRPSCTWRATRPPSSPASRCRWMGDIRRSEPAAARARPARTLHEAWGQSPPYSRKMTGATELGRGEGTVFGSGWISGVLAVTFAALAFGGVLCLLFPWLLTTPDARGHYPLDVVRFLIYAFLVAGFVLGALSAILRRSRVLGVTALALATAA